MTPLLSNPGKDFAVPNKERLIREKKEEWGGGKIGDGGGGFRGRSALLGVESVEVKFLNEYGEGSRKYILSAPSILMLVVQRGSLFYADEPDKTESMTQVYVKHSLKRRHEFHMFSPYEDTTRAHPDYVSVASLTLSCSTTAAFVFTAVVATLLISTVADMALFVFYVPNAILTGFAEEREKGYCNRIEPY
ncbi:hypothetical protein Tco_0434418 [Tanacetum coccineum]